MTPLAHLHFCQDARHVSAVVTDFVRRRDLFNGVSRLGVAVSGGADSVALIHLLLPLCKEAGLCVTVLHFNHGLRAEAAADERFVRQLAESAGVSFLSRSAQLAEQPRKGLSIEMLAREVRQHYFRQCSAELQLDAIATGHQADDVAETVLLKLARGAGAAGLSGLRPLTHLGGLTIMRPLLSVTSSALRDWLTQKDLPWREDLTNLDTSIPRNFVRHNLLPQLEKNWSSDLRQRLCQSADILREDDDCLETLAAGIIPNLTKSLPQDQGTSLSAPSLLAQPLAIQRRALRLWLFANGCSQTAGFETVERALRSCRSGGDWALQLDAHARLVCTKGRLAVLHPAPRAEGPPPLNLVIGASVRWGGLTISAERDFGICRSSTPIDTYPSVATLSANAVEGQALQVRSRSPGDCIAPTGLNGSKKIQDLFVDEKVPESVRDTIPLIACGEEIAWVPGYRVARRFAVPGPDAPSIRITVCRDE